MRKYVTHCTGPEQPDSLMTLSLSLSLCHTLPQHTHTFSLSLSLSLSLCIYIYMPHRQPLGDLIARHLPYDDCRVPRLQLNHYLLRIHIFNIVCRACL